MIFVNVEPARSMWLLSSIQKDKYQKPGEANESLGQVRKLFTRLFAIQKSPLSLQSSALRANLPAMVFQEYLALRSSFNARSFWVSSEPQGLGADILEGEWEREMPVPRRRGGAAGGERIGDFERPVEGSGRSEGSGAARCRTGGGTLAEAARCGRS